MRYWLTVEISCCMIWTTYKHAQPLVVLIELLHICAAPNRVPTPYVSSTAFSTTYTLGDNHDRARFKLSTVMRVKDLVPLSRRPTCAQHSLDRPCNGRSLNLVSCTG